MTVIVPRWEWRTFAEEFGAADAVVAALEPTLVQESDETYLLSPGADAAVKIRAGLMDIKLLERVSGEGLEQWRPALKETFPLASGEADKVCAALGVSAPPAEGDAFSLEELLAMLAAPERGVRAVAVHKLRRHYSVDDCMTEMTEVVADGRRARTLALESEDPKRVIAAVRELGLSSRTNTSYPRWLKVAAGMET